MIKKKGNGNGEYNRLRFEILDQSYIIEQKYLRALYESDKAREQAKMLSGYYHPYHRWRRSES